MPKFTPVNKEVAPICQAAVDLVQWADDVKCNSGSEANAKAILHALPLLGPLRDAIQKEDAVKIFQIARMVSHELKKRPEELPKPMKKLIEVVNQVLHEQGQESN